MDWLGPVAASDRKPHCHILVVEGSSNLETAAQVAQSSHLVAISNSWGGGQFNREQNDQNTYFSDPGVAITALAATHFVVKKPARRRVGQRFDRVSYPAVVERNCGQSSTSVGCVESASMLSSETSSCTSCGQPCVTTGWKRGIFR